MRIAALVLVGLAVLGGGGVSRADDEGVGLPAPGSRLRLRIAGEPMPVVGKLVSEDGETLVLKVRAMRGSPMTVRLDSIESMDVSRPRSGLGTCAGILAGAALGASVGGRDGAWAGTLIALPGAAAGASSVRGGGGVAKGALVGAGTSVVIWGGLALLLTGADDEWWSDGQLALLVAGGGAIYGALSGGVAAAVGHERWEAVSARRLRLNVTPVRGGGVAASVQFSF